MDGLVFEELRRVDVASSEKDARRDAIVDLHHVSDSVVGVVEALDRLVVARTSGSKVGQAKAQRVVFVFDPGGRRLSILVELSVGDSFALPLFVVVDAA